MPQIRNLVTLPKGIVGFNAHRVPKKNGGREVHPPLCSIQPRADQ
jgi:hypothetical protein